MQNFLHNEYNLEMNMEDLPAQEEHSSQGLFNYLRSIYTSSSDEDRPLLEDNGGAGRLNIDAPTSSSNAKRVISDSVSFPSSFSAAAASSSSSSTANDLMTNPNFQSSSSAEHQLPSPHHDEQHVFDSLDSNETERFLSEPEMQCYGYNFSLQIPTHNVMESSDPSSTTTALNGDDDVISNEIPLWSSAELLQSSGPRDPKLEHLSIENHNNSSSLFCFRMFDGALCWPETPAGYTATLPCFNEFHGIPYDTSRNATRYCEENGVWQNRSDYSSCQPVKPPSSGTNEDNLEITTRVYFYGYCLSLGALTIAMLIFLLFKELRCLRNTIHTHLIITYILSDMLWIITSSTTFTGSHDPVNHPGRTNQVSCVTFILLHYFHLTNFFWMFVEGLYLYVLVVLTFVADNIKLRIYACIGWGLPLMVVIGWMIAKFASTQSATVDIQATDPEFNVSTCLWLTVNLYDWIYKVPAILVLGANMIFLLQIMWVLITKLRSATNPETQQSRKAAKALVVLMPLLGITYVLVLTGSKTAVYEYLRALLISTQGFLVSLLYCFLNNEVKIALRHRFDRLRSMGPDISCCDRREQVQHTRDWRSRTESLRLYETTSRQSYRKRDSSVSETTMTTPLHTAMNNGSAGNGSGLMSRRMSTTYSPASQKYYSSIAKVEHENSARV